MMPAFDQITIRHGSRSIKWDYLEERGRLRPLLEKRRPLVPAEGLYLAWVDCRASCLDEAGLKKAILEEARVSLEWGSHFGAQGEGFVRINLACPQPILQTALERIRRSPAFRGQP